VSVKDLRSGTQETVPRASAAAVVARRLQNRDPGTENPEP